MKRLLPLFILFALWAQSASAQIAFDAASGAALNTPSWSHVVGVGSNLVLVVGEFDDNGASNLLTAVTWDAAGTPQSFTKIAQVQNPGDRWFSLWYLLNPASGTKNITITTTAGASKASAISLSGVGGLDTACSGSACTNTTANATTIAVTMTVAANSWIVSVAKESFSSGYSVSPGLIPAVTEANGLHMGYSNGALSGSQTTTYTSSNSVTQGLVAASFTVSGSSPPTSSPTPCLMRLLGVGCEVP